MAHTLRSGQRITLTPNDDKSMPRQVSGILAYYTDTDYFLMLGHAALPCQFPMLAWHIDAQTERRPHELNESGICIHCDAGDPTSVVTLRESCPAKPAQPEAQ